jgi:hypothetical protein
MSFTENCRTKQDWSVQLYSVQIQTENDSYWQNKKFVLFAKYLKMYRTRGTLPFFDHIHLKFAKSANMT